MSHVGDAILFRYIPPKHRHTSNPTVGTRLNLLFICILPIYLSFRLITGLATIGSDGIGELLGVCYIACPIWLAQTLFGTGSSDQSPDAIEEEEAPLLRRTSTATPWGFSDVGLKQWTGLINLVITLAPLAYYFLVFRYVTYCPECPPVIF
jgi:hypothetical protein